MPVSLIHSIPIPTKNLIQRGHPEWVINQGQMPSAPQIGNPQNTLNLNEMFPNLIPFQIPPIPQLAVRNFLEGGEKEPSAN